MSALPSSNSGRIPRLSLIRKYVSRLRPHWSEISAFVVPFVLVVLLALDSGGYDILARSKFGIFIWWLVLLGVAVGLLPLIRVTRFGWLIVGLLTALAAWVGIAALTWTQATERSVIETGRVVTMLGFLVFLVLAQGRRGLRGYVAAVGAAAAAVAVIALLSRYQPDWFSIGHFPEGYPVARLNYPLGYWNGLAALMAMGLPALITLASGVRNLFVRAASAAVIPLTVLAAYMTASRGGVFALALAILLLIAIHPRRIVAALTMIGPVAGSVVLIWLINQRQDLRDNLETSQVSAQAAEMMILTLVVVAAVFAVNWFGHRLSHRRGLRVPAVSRGFIQKVAAAIATGGAVLLIVALASGFAGDQWSEFKAPQTGGTTVDRYANLNSGERYLNWVAAVEAAKAEPLTGIGPGAFEFWWSRNGEGRQFVRDAHSFYLEAFGELGIVGLLLVLALVLIPIGIAVTGALAPRQQTRRPYFAAAAAGMVAFAVSAALDWAWEMTVLAVMFWVYVAAVTGPDAEFREGRFYRKTLRLPLLSSQKWTIAVGSLAAIVLIALPMAGTLLIRDSQKLYREGEPGALSKAKKATEVNPWAASADIQVALLYLSDEQPEKAVEYGEKATQNEPYDWKAWQVLSQAAAAAGDESTADEAIERARSLNKRIHLVIGE